MSGRAATPPAALSALRLLLACALLIPAQDGRADTASQPRSDSACETVRLADIGWTDVTATTALLAAVLRELGYRAQTTVLSVPVTFASIKHADIDVFLGNWMPAQEANRRPFIADGSIEVIGANLTGARYTLAVPAYSYEAGLRSFSDIARFGTSLGNVIYGIEPGNDGNRSSSGCCSRTPSGLAPSV
jgi:glycine betaine/proline transport system substrate-binding protein